MKIKKLFICLIDYLGTLCILPLLGILALIYFKRIDFFVISIITFLLLVMHYFCDIYTK